MAIPQLKRPINSTRTRVSDRFNFYQQESNPPRERDRVRFADTTYSSRRTTPSSLSQSEREKRKLDALEFLKAGSYPNEDQLSLKKRLRSRNSNGPKNYTDKKTFELLGEDPISNLSRNSSRNMLNDDSILKNIKRESLRRSPLNNISRIRNGNTYRITKQDSNRKGNGGLFESLSNIGSKLLSSILYNEKSTDLDNSLDINSGKSTFLKEKNEEELRKLREEQRVSDIIRDQTLRLDELNKNLELKTLEKEKELKKFRAPFVEAESITSQVDGLDSRLENILREISSDSNSKLLTELTSIKNELVGLKKKQDSNNMRFESKFEDLRMEAQLNKRNFEKLMTELEEKRDELDREKNKIIRILQKENKKKRKREIYNTISFDSEEDEPSSDNISSDDNEKNERYTNKSKLTKRRKLNSDDIRARVAKLTKNVRTIEQSMNKNLLETKEMKK